MAESAPSGGTGSPQYWCSAEPTERPVALIEDGLPLVGTTETEGLYLHAGHGSIGMQAAPATARWLAELVAGDRQAPELSRLRPDRFS